MGLITVKIDSAAGGDLFIVAAVAGQKVRLYSWEIVAAAAATAQWKDGAGTTLTGAMTLATGIPNISASSPNAAGTLMPIFTTTAGNALILATTAVQVSGWAIVAQY